MRMELRIVVSARHMSECRRNHPVGGLSRSATRRETIAASLEIIILDPIKGHPHRRIMSMHDRAASMVEGF